MRPLPITVALALLAGALTPAGARALPQTPHAQTSCVAVRPGHPDEVWTLNRDNGSVSVVDLVQGLTTHEIDVGVWPRSLSFTPDGARVFVADQRGNVPVDVHFVTPFTGNERRGTISVIDATTRSRVATLEQVGTEPYGVLVAPNGKYFAVTGFRSATVRFYDASSLAFLRQFAYPADIDFIFAPQTIADIDANQDGLADLGEPRGFTIRQDSRKLYVTHHRSPYLSVLDVALDANGLPAAVTLESKILLDDYPFHPIFAPVPVQTLASQGVPRFSEDVALSPSHERAFMPQVLHNVNHDVNHDFGPGFPGDFANRVYPSLTVVDALRASFGQAGDWSTRLHHELSDSLTPAEYVPFGTPARTAVGYAVLGGEGSPVLGGKLRLVVDGLEPGQVARIWMGREKNVSLGGIGTQYCKPRFVFPVPPGGVWELRIPDRNRFDGLELCLQAAIHDAQSGQLVKLSNGVRAVLGRDAYGVGQMGRRAGQPSRVAFDQDGDRLLMLNRGSEDLFLYRVQGSQLELMTAYPPRHGFVERTALDTSTPLGDLPLGMVLADDPSTVNDDARLFVTNELTRTLSVLRVDYTTGAIFAEGSQIPTLLGPDELTLSERIGSELFEDASRAQTTGAAGTVGGFNNSCASCHFEGGEDANVWQRPTGPRSTMPVYGGPLLTGLMLWKGVRVNMGETGPMFGGENGGHGILSDIEQQGLVDIHPKMPVPLNPHLHPVTGGYDPLAAMGKDLFFGTNDTSLNPTGRHAGCFECHPDADSLTGAVRGYTTDFLDPVLTGGEMLGILDPACVSLRSGVVASNVRNVNSGVNVDRDNNGIPDPDRNFDGFRDHETYTPMNTDKDDDFQRDDMNSWLCPIDPNDPNGPRLTFGREMREFSVPTKLGVFSSGPYFHDHSAFSLRMVLDPGAQTTDPVYGSPAYPGRPLPGLKKFFNEFHDVRGHEQRRPGASKVQLNLQSTDVDADIEALLAYIRSL